MKRFIREIPYANLSAQQMLDLEEMGFILELKPLTVEIWVDAPDVEFPKAA